MINKNTEIKTLRLAVRRWALACAVAGLLPGIGLADVFDTSWDITALSRTDVTAIKAPGLIPEHTVDIFDDTYTFAANGDFSASGLTAGWSQRITRAQTQYTVTLNQYDVWDLEDQFRSSLQQNEPTIYIHQLKLLSRKLNGYELDNGIWGTERYEYKVDSTLDGFRDVVRIVQNIQVVGYPPVVAAAAKANVSVAQTTAQKPARSAALDAAAAAVLKHMRQGAGAQ